MPNNKQHNATDFWYGYTVLCHGVPLYLYDHRDTDPNWKGAVTLTGVNLTRVNVAKYDMKADVALPLPPSPPPQAKHAIIHDDNPDSLYTSDDSVLIVLWVSTTSARGGAHQIIPPPPDGAKVVQFSMTDGNAYRNEAKWLGEYVALTFEQAKKLAAFTTRSQATEFEENFSHLLDIILPGRIETQLAFRLLCEAKHECGGQPSKNLGELTIHAPQELNEWLAPFSPVGPDDPSKIVSVARMMGKENEVKAKGVLETVNETPPDNVKVQKAVNHYLGIPGEHPLYPDL